MVKIKKIGIMYHKVDLDGICSASIVFKKHCNEEEYEVKFIPHNYGFQLPNKEYDILYAVDLGLKFDEVKTLHNQYDEFIWIDHHKTAIDEYEKRKHELNSEVKGIRSIEKSACELTWEFLFKEVGFTPFIVKTLSKYDSWKNEDKNEWEKVIMPTQMYFKTYFFKDNTKNFNFIKCLSLIIPLDIQDNCESQEKINEIINIGTHIYEYQKNMWMSKSKYAKLSKLGDLNVLFMNTNERSSSVFMGCDITEDIDVLCIATLNGEIWEYSIYKPSDKSTINCGEIAEKYGGGGHVGAAGFKNADFLIK